MLFLPSSEHFRILLLDLAYYVLHVEWGEGYLLAFALLRSSADLSSLFVLIGRGIYLNYVISVFRGLAFILPDLMRCNLS